MYLFPLRLHVYPGWNKLLEGYLSLLQLKDAVDVLWCFKTHFGRKCCWWYCPLLWPDHVFFFYIPQDKNPIRGEIVLSSNDLALELQVERNQWVFLCSYHLLCLITFVYYNYLQLFHFLSPDMEELIELGDIEHCIIIGETNKLQLHFIPLPVHFLLTLYLLHSLLIPEHYVTSLKSLLKNYDMTFLYECSGNDHSWLLRP